MVKKRFKLALDSRSGRVVHIDKVSEGFEFGMCAGCQSPVVASNWNLESRKKVTYFRHKAESNCLGESLIHLWAKQVIAAKGKVLGAEYIAAGEAKDFGRKIHNFELVQAPENLCLVRIELEKRLMFESDFRTPDVMCEVADSGSTLAIEVFVNNSVNDQKALFFDQKQLDCLEIDLSSIPGQIEDYPEDFERYVINEAPRIWIYCNRYRELEAQAQYEAEKMANSASKKIKLRRAENRRLKSQWRKDNCEFVELVQAYLLPDNQKRVEVLYQSHLDQPGTISNHYRGVFESSFGGIPDVINIPLKGELAFNCHRSVWQWEVYRRIVLEAYLKTSQAYNKLLVSMRATRGYDASRRHEAWNEFAPKFSPACLYESIKHIPQNKISSEAERIVGGPLTTEGNKPDSLVGLKVKEWQELPKPVCVIRRYIIELLRMSVLELDEGDTYMMPLNGELPIKVSFSSLKKIKVSLDEF